MKIAFDENMPAAMVRVFKLFHAERSLKHIVRGVTVESAKDYTPQPGDPDHVRKNDVPWIKRYAAAGGKVIVSGDVKMASVPHERLALVQEGMIVIFFSPKWDNWQFCRKAALLLHWWPTILAHVRKAKPGFFVVPCSWPEEDATLRQISSKDMKLERIQKQLAEQEPKRLARKLKRDAIEGQESLALETGDREVKPDQSADFVRVAKKMGTYEEGSAVDVAMGQQAKGLQSGKPVNKTAD